ncbi:hypothetical protein NPIL_86611 [Nephila pilipes]|uniref:Uncharacterized protein n=1 Tax=Nephila pilipes TaxID=299642 RepID=A0A8X6U4B0_NEPPI|nr:hypothetical protein NPIL_86611 [Nephila pilipes]
MYQDHVPQTQQTPIIKISVSLIIPKDKLGFNQTNISHLVRIKVKMLEKCLGPTSYYDDCIHEDLVGQNNKHIEIAELKEDEEHNHDH